MRRFLRVPAPEFLAERWEQWGREWEERRAADSRASFHWHEVGGEPVNRKLLPALKAQVQDHCSFCDNFVRPTSPDTIEHFRPKTRFPREAYKWENLYYCCASCQAGKGDGYDEALLRPDAEDYAFKRYFWSDHTTGELKVNDQASPKDQHRAEVTIDLYRLNSGHPRFRKLAARRRSQAPNDPLDDFPYRDFVRSPAA